MKQLKSYEIDRLSFDDTIDNVIKQLQELKASHSQHQNLRIKEESTYDGGYYYWLVGDRLETDAEEAHREKSEAEWALRHLENQRLQYEALKAKFEPSIKTEL